MDSCQSLAHLFQIQARLIVSGLLQVQNPSFSCRLLNLCFHYCDINYTALVFKCIDFPNAFSVNTVIKSYACSSMPHNAVLFYFERLKNGHFAPNSFTFPPLMSACANTGTRRLELGQKCHGQSVKNGVNGVLQVQNSLVHLYACCGFIGLAKQVFDEMTDRDVVS